MVDGWTTGLKTGLIKGCAGGQTGSGAESLTLSSPCGHTRYVQERRPEGWGDAKT